MYSGSAYHIDSVYVDAVCEKFRIGKPILVGVCYRVCRLNIHFDAVAKC